MNIVCSIDNGYVEHCCVMLYSFFKNNTGTKHSVFLLGEDLTVENQEIISLLVSSFNGYLTYCPIAKKIVKDCPINENDHLTIATYYRLFMAKLLPQEIDKVLYLDCDLVINGSLKELWETNIDSYALAAVEEMGWHYSDVYERLGFNKKHGYFNAGVLLINLEYWRRQHLTECFINYLNQNSTKLKAHDQDVLNATLHDKCLHISCKWNVETGFCMYDFIKLQNFDPSLLKIISHPVIIHYTWKPKPWQGQCKHPYRIVYYIYCNKLPIKNLFKRSLSLEKRLRLYLYKYLFQLLLLFSVKKRQYYKI